MRELYLSLLLCSRVPVRGFYRLPYIGDPTGVKVESMRSIDVFHSAVVPPNS